MRVSLRARNPFSSFFVSSRREQYLAEYVVRECSHGRSLGEVLADRYVLNRSTSEERARLLERPEIVEAIGEQAVAELKQGLTAGTAARAPR
jgi:hypothetical protein